jgi:hypothetical protein
VIISALFSVSSFMVSFDEPPELSMTLFSVACLPLQIISSTLAARKDPPALHGLPPPLVPVLQNLLSCIPAVNHLLES